MADQLTDQTEINFTIEVTMQKRWVPHFLSMLKLMDQFGKVGKSRKVTFYADGDGDFRPTFKWPVILSSAVIPIEDDKGDCFYDAG